MVAAAVRSSSDTLVLAVLPGRIQARWGETSKSIPADAARLGAGWLFGEAARDTPDPVDVVETVDHLGGTDSSPVEVPDPGALLTGLVRYTAAAVGAPPTVDTAVVVHPTWWNERRRRLLHSAARQIAHNAVLVPAAIAACRAARHEGAEGYVVLEIGERGVTATSVVPGPVHDSPAIGRVARAPDITGADLAAVADLAAEEAVASLITAVTADQDGTFVLIVVGGGPSSVSAWDRSGDGIGTTPVVSVDAAEMTRSMSSPPRESPSRAEVSAPVPWLQEVRPSVPAPDARNRWIGTVLVGVVTAGVLAALFLWVGAPESHRPEGPGATATDLGTEITVGRSPEGDGPPGTEHGERGATRFDVGPVQLDLPSSWRLRNPETADSGRAELVPSSGSDRRIVVVYSVLASGMDEGAVAAVLDARAAERGQVIRNLDSDTTFADRSVIAYTEVPDEFSEVRWSVVVFPGLQAAVGCQYLGGEWAGIRSECEQAVHTIRTG